MRCKDFEAKVHSSSGNGERDGPFLDSVYVALDTPRGAQLGKQLFVHWDVMRTIKLVIVGDSHTGKTSLRTQYITGRFSTGYRATIGADFYSKTIPHYRDANEQICVQIWDTAGQERFSSLSRAFFRGADAVLLVFDVNTPSTLESLRKWWHTFSDYAPVPEEEAFNFCTVFVGNKVDLLAGTQVAGQPFISQHDAESFIESLFPGAAAHRSPAAPEESSVPPPDEPVSPASPSPRTDPLEDVTNIPQRSTSIDIHLHGPGNHSHRPKFSSSDSRATSRSRFGGTVATTRSGLSIYHTPSSSVFDQFMSAASSPPSPFDSPRPTHSRHLTRASISSTGSTVMPSLVNGASDHGIDNDVPLDSHPIDTAEADLDVGPRLFFTSAKTGESVGDVFAYVARRVVARQEWEECRTPAESDSDETVRPIAPSTQSSSRQSCCV